MENPAPGQSVHPDSTPETPNTAENSQAFTVSSSETSSMSQVAEPVFQAEVPNEVTPRMQSNDGSISWTASEYVEHHKSSLWYAALLAVMAVLVALTYLLTHGDMLSVGVIVFVAVIFGVYAGRPPRVQRYAISDEGVTIAQKTYSFGQFKSFSVVHEGPIPGISFAPLRRFMPVLTIYYDPNDEDKIIGTLSHYLPIETHQQDFVDRFIRRIRF